MFLDIFSRTIDNNYAYILSFAVLFLASKVFSTNIRVKKYNMYVMLYAIFTIVYCFIYQYASIRWELQKFDNCIFFYDSQLWYFIEFISLLLMGLVHLFLCLHTCYKESKND